MLARVLMGLTPVLMLCAQDIQPPNNQTQVPKHTITGTVTNAVTGEPIRRALVQLFGQIQMSVLTGPDGRFRFDDVPEGQVVLNSQKPGFKAANANKPQTVDSGSNDFALKLDPDARMSGHVTDGNGEPIEGANVQAMAEVIQQGRKRWQMGRTATTDDDGGFEIDDLTPGHYVIYCGGHPVPPTNWKGPREVDAPMYFPDAKETASAQVVDLQPGQEFAADFHLHRERGYTVSAQVIGLPAIGGIPLNLENDMGQPVRFGKTSFERARGQFTAEGVPSGTWILAFRGGDQAGNTYQIQQEFTVDHSDLTGLQVQVQPDATIPVIVNRADNQPAQPPSLVGNGRFLTQNVNVQARLIPDIPSRIGNYFAVMHGDPQSMKFRGVPAGKYQLSVQSFGDECVDSATYGGVDLMRDELVVGTGGAAQPVIINIGSDCAVLQAQIKSENPSANIVIVPTTGVQEPIVRPIGAQSAGGPTYVSQWNLSAGTYQVFAFANVDGLEYANPEAMRNYSGQSVTLEAGQTKDITVEISERKDR